MCGAIRAGYELAQQEPPKSEDYGHICITGDVLSKKTEFVTLLKSLNLWKAMGALLGSDNLACHFSRLSIKTPGYRGMVHWHRDLGNQSLSIVTSDFLRVFIPLTIFNETDGAPRIVRQSNKINDSAVKLSKKLNSWDTKSFPLEHPLCCSPGDIVFMHPKTRHCNGQNDSDKPRINLIMQVGITKCPVSQKINHKEHFIARLLLYQDGGYQ